VGGKGEKKRKIEYWVIIINKKKGKINGHHLNSPDGTVTPGHSRPIQNIKQNCTNCTKKSALK